MMNNRTAVFIGFDDRQQRAYDACKYSIEKNASGPIDIYKLEHRELREKGFFNREWTIDGATGRYIDKIEGKPFSNQFSHTRFAVPTFAQYLGYSGAAIFVDCDFIFLDDVENLVEETFDYNPIYVVKHPPYGRNGVKMDNQSQKSYDKKLWSSLIMFNLRDHVYTDKYTDWVNSASGMDLHQLKWWREEDIGAIDPSWNYIPGFTSKNIHPSAIHYTEGLPIMEGYERCELSSVFNRCLEESIT